MTNYDFIKTLSEEKMAKICLEDTGDNSTKVSVDGTGGELINLFSNAFLKEGYLRVAAARG